MMPILLSRVMTSQQGVQLSADKRNETISENHATSIMLVEDHASFRQALAFLFEAEPDFTVAAQVGTLAEAREVAKGSPEQVDIAVVDLGLPDGDGVDLVQELSARMDIATLVLSASVDRARFAQAVEAGAAGVLHKATAIDEIVSAVRRLRAGQALLSQSEVVEMLRVASTEREKGRKIKSAFDKLTRRERQVLAALAEGLDSKEIASRLHITVETERTHMVKILTKLGVHSRLQALVLAARHGLVEIR
jgi:two-component system, NarL family, nitrate/nitrite response regulator NarL